MRPALILLLALYSTYTVGQTESEIPALLLKFAPQNLAANTMKVGAEVFNKKKTKSLSLYAYARWDDRTSLQPVYIYDERYQGLGGELVYRKYIHAISTFTNRKNRTYVRGVYVGGYIQGAAYSNDGNYYFSQYQNNQFTTTMLYVQESIGNWGAGFIIGMQRTLWNVLYIDMYIGSGLQWADVIRRETPPSSGYQHYPYRDITTPGYQGILPKFGIQIGVPM